MDVFAINNCSDEELKEMGLKARGDIIALRAFCKAPFASSSKQKLNELKMAVRQNNRVATPAPKSKEKTLFRFAALPQETEKVSVRSSKSPIWWR